MTDTRFKKGQSGNPKGRPKGARHKTTVAVEVLLDGEAEAITRKAIEKAKQGDMIAIRLCMDRIAPQRKDRHIAFGLPMMETAKDAAVAAASIVKNVAEGELTPSEAGELMKIVEGFARSLLVSDFEERLERLEKMRAA
jgi:hypothetical protein